MKRIDPDDDEPAPFVPIKRQRALFNRPFNTSDAGPSGCTGKIPYPSAHAAAKAIRFKTNIDGRRAYRCSVCHQWHIGNATRTKPE